MKNSGYHMLRLNDPATPELVYCNFTKRLFDPDIQINYGPMRKMTLFGLKLLKMTGIELILPLIFVKSTLQKLT